MAATATQTTLVRRVRRTLDDAGSPLVGRHVLALCSGGADSVALVALLAALPRGAAPRAIDVLWLDHGLRSNVEAERAAAHAVAEHVGAGFHELRAMDDLRVRPGGLEGAARTWRYAHAQEFARALACDVVCTGHTASDQVEQALLSLVGVTGRGGVADAMPVSRTLDSGLLLVRPLLGCARDDVEQACSDEGLAWAEDPTNVDPDAHVRNAVRHRVVPALLDLGPDAGVSIARAGRRERERADATRALADALLDSWRVDPEPPAVAVLDVRRLASLPPSARREMLAAWLLRAPLGRALSTRSVDAVDRLAMLPGRAACSRIDLGRNTCVRRDGYDLTITTSLDAEGPTP